MGRLTFKWVKNYQDVEKLKKNPAESISRVLSKANSDYIGSGLVENEIKFCRGDLFDLVD